MYESFTVSKKTRFFVMICKSAHSVHSYQFLGMEEGNTKQILGGFGKIGSDYPPERINNCGQILDHLATSCGFYFSDIEGKIINEWLAGQYKEREITYKAYSINYSQYIDYLQYIKKISLKQKNKHAPLLAYCPKAIHDSTSAMVELEWKAVDLIPDNVNIEEDIYSHTRIGSTNNCRTSAITLTQRATNLFEGLGRGVSSFFGSALPLNTSTSYGIMGGHKFYIGNYLPSNPKNYRYSYFLVEDKLHYINHNGMVENINVNNWNLFNQTLVDIRKKHFKRTRGFGLYVTSNIPETISKYINHYILLQETGELFYVTPEGVLKKQEGFKDATELNEGLKTLLKNTGLSEKDFFDLNSRQIKQWITSKGATDRPIAFLPPSLQLSTDEVKALISKHSDHRLVGADERHIFILPLPPKSFPEVSKKKLSILNRLYDRLDQLILDQQYNQLTIDKFEKIKSLYESITSHEKSDLKVIFHEIEKWISENLLLIKAHRNSHWFSFQTATEKMFSNLLTEGREYRPL